MRSLSRFYLGVALALQKDGPGKRLNEAISYLFEGMETLISKLAEQQAWVTVEGYFIGTDPRASHESKKLLNLCQVLKKKTVFVECHLIFKTQKCY